MESRTGKRKGDVPFYKKKGLIWTLVFLFVMVLSGAGYYAYSIYSFTKNISKPKNSVTKAVDDWSGKDRINIALFGVDSRPGDGPPRSDSIMILSIDPATKKASLFSVMRDTYYKIPGHGFHKINEAFALGGPELAEETVSKFIQLPINYYVKTNFDGFAKIVDALGGIDINVEKDMYWPDDGVYDINLQKGQQHLDGKHALMYVRFRHDAMSDYTRTERQRNFLVTLAKEMKSSNGLLKLPSILSAISNDIETDMSFNDMIKLGKLTYDLDTSSLQSIQLPPMHDETGTKPGLIDGYREDAGSIIIPDVYETRLLVQKTLHTGELAIKPTDDQEPLVSQLVEAKPTPTPTPPVPKESATPPVPKTDGSTPSGSTDPKNGGTKAGDPKPGTTGGSTGNTGTGGSTGTGSGTDSPTIPPKSGGTSTTPGTTAPYTSTVKSTL